MKPPRLLLVLAAVPGLAAAWGVLALTDPPGPGLDPDALSYLGAGISLARGDGLRVPSAAWASADTTAPLVHFPPGFSTAIALGIKLGETPINAARFVEAAAACASVMFIMFSAAAGGGPVAAILALDIAAISPALVLVHASVLSEPLFLALLVGFAGVLATEREGRETRRALSLGALAAAAVLVRYVGASLVAALVLDALIAPLAVGAVGGRGRWFLRIRRAALAAAIPTVALGTWILTRPRNVDAEKVREVGLYVSGLGATLQEGAGSLARWFAPGIAGELALTFLAVTMMAAVVVLVGSEMKTAARDMTRASELRLFRTVGIVAPCYLIVLIASRLLADPGIPFDDRLMAPLFLLAAPAVGVALVRWQRSALPARRYGAMILSAGITVSWIAGSAQVSTQLVREFRADGADLASEDWRLSPLVAWAANAPPGTHLYSNWPAAIWFHTGRATFELPTDVDMQVAKAFGAKLAQEHGALLDFRELSPDVASPDSLAAMAGLVAKAKWADATVWMSAEDALRPKTAGATLDIRPESLRVRLPHVRSTRR